MPMCDPKGYLNEKSWGILVQLTFCNKHVFLEACLFVSKNSSKDSKQIFLEAPCKVSKKTTKGFKHIFLDTSLNTQKIHEELHTIQGCDKRHEFKDAI